MDIADKRLQSYLDLAIYLVNPAEKWPAHVTIAGPFPRKIDVPRTLTFDQEVYVVGRGRFADTNTVFLHVGSLDMLARLHKPDFPTAIPHLTLYDGSDANTADLLYNALEGVKLFKSFKAHSLRVVKAGSQKNFGLRLEVDPKLLPGLGQIPLSQIEALPIEARVKFAVLALRVGFSVPRKVGPMTIGRPA